MREIRAAGEYQPTKVKIFRNIVFALFDCFVDIGDRSLVLVHVEGYDGSMVVYAGDMVVGELGKVGDGFVEVLFDLLDDRGLLLEEVSLDATHGEVEVGLGFVGVVTQGFLKIGWGGLMEFRDCFD